jgi:neutral ceramidase
MQMQIIIGNFRSDYLRFRRIGEEIPEIFRQQTKGEAMKKKIGITMLLVFAAVFTAGNCLAGAPSGQFLPETNVADEPVALNAGASEVDITPGPGLPLFGHSIMAASSAKGYWTRLKARSIVLQNPGQSRIALVQVDLGAVSGLLHEKVCERLANEEFQPEDVLICASHTHAGPGGFFGNCFYNSFGSGRGGYFPLLVEFLAERIAFGVRMACEDMAPSQVAFGELSLDGFSRNRSLEAWKWNDFEGVSAPPYSGVIPRISMLRVDRDDEANPGKTMPIAALVVVPVHATAVNSGNKLYHGDLLGVAARMFAAGICSPGRPAHRFVAAVAVGPLGDVSPNWINQGQDEAIRLGGMIAKSLMELHGELKDGLAKAQVQRWLKKSFLPGAKTQKGELCAKPMVGVPVLGGAEDGRSFLYGRLGVYEGNRGPVTDCQAEKVYPLHFKFILKTLSKVVSVPEVAPLHIVKIGDLVTFAALPVEATTETGRGIHDDLQTIAGTRFISLIGVANEYISYTATEPEYRAQHFEGAMTMYGPWQALFLKEQLHSLLASDPQVRATRQEMEVRYNPGKQRKLKVASGPVAEDKWLIIEKVKVAAGNGRLEARLKYSGPTKKEAYKILPMIFVLRDGRELIGLDGLPENDEGFNFQVIKGRNHKWEVVWRPSAELLNSLSFYQIGIARTQLPPIISEPFFLK